MTEQKPDLTTDEAVTKSEQVYQRIVTGECKDAAAELDRAHGINR
jgi:hypothetical protein